MVIDIEKVIIQDRIRKDFGDIQELANDIKENGLINPPVVNKDYHLLAGERRIRACKSLGWKQIEIRMMDTRDAEHELNVEISENDVRKGFSKSERVDYMKRLLHIEEAKAKERQKAGINLTKKSSEGGEARQKTAEQFGISHDTMRKEISIVDNKKLISVEDFKEWDEGRLSTNKAFQKVKQKLDASNKRIEELESRKPEIKEVVKNVVPDDYEELKRKAKMSDAHKSDFQYMQGRYQEMAEKWKKAEHEKDALIAEMNKPEEKKKHELRLSAFHFCTGVALFLEEYGGYAYLMQEIDSLEEKERERIQNAVRSIRDWAEIMSNEIVSEVIT